MTDRHVDRLIVGGGGAGAACAEALATASFDGTVLLAGREEDPPYERPYASKEYLHGKVEREETHLRPRGWWEEQGIELLTRTSVLKMDLATRVASLAGGDSVHFGQALVATGANVRRLNVPGAQLEGIHYLRALGNADAIRQDAEQAERVVLIGGSYIACEVAATLTALGKRCTLVMQEALPLSRGFGETAGRFFAARLGERSIDWVGDDALERFEGSDDYVRRVVTASGRVLDADLVIMGTGAVPDVMLARSAGLELGPTGGIACSPQLETSATGIWAAGDPCEYPSPIDGRPLRIEHWEVARAQGRTVADAMMGKPRDYDDIAYFWSDLADWCTLEYVGLGARWDREILRGSSDDGSLCVFYLNGDRVVGALTVGCPKELDHARRLLDDRVVVECPVALADEHSDLAAIAPDP